MGLEVKISHCWSDHCIFPIENVWILSSPHDILINAGLTPLGERARVSLLRSHGVQNLQGRAEQEELVSNRDDDVVDVDDDNDDNADDDDADFDDAFTIYQSIGNSTTD